MNRYSSRGCALFLDGAIFFVFKDNNPSKLVAIYYLILTFSPRTCEFNFIFPLWDNQSRCNSFCKWFKTVACNLQLHSRPPYLLGLGWNRGPCVTPTGEASSPKSPEYFSCVYIVWISISICHNEQRRVFSSLYQDHWWLTYQEGSSVFIS